MRNDLRFYVYTLAYPDGTVFYVGKGSKSRIMNHEADASNRDRAHTYHNRKSEIIRQIWQEGGQVLKQKVAFFRREDEAYAFEKELIGSLGKEHLINLKDGGIGGRCHPRPDVSGLPLVDQFHSLEHAYRRVTVDMEQARKLAILAQQSDTSIDCFVESLIEQAWKEAIQE